MTPSLPDWATWKSDQGRPPWTVGVEEEVMLLDPQGWALAHRIDSLLPELSQRLVGSVSAETHACTLELATGVHTTVRAAAAELYSLRVALAEELESLGLRPAVAGTHPLALGHEVEVSGGARYQLLHEGLRVLARREPTFALHVHVGVPDAELAIRAADRLRAHLPLILALSANSPFWAGRDTGMASVRTPLFQAFPRAGVPRYCGSYQTYVERLDVLLRAGAFPEPTFVWSDVRLQPRFGTVEVRVADAQTGVAEVAAIAAVIQALVRIEATEELADEALVDAHEVIEGEPLPRGPGRDGRAARGPGSRCARARRRAIRGGARRVRGPRGRARLAGGAGGGGDPRPALRGRAPAPAGAQARTGGRAPRARQRLPGPHLAGG